MSDWFLVVKVKKNHSFKPTGSISIKEKLKFPLFYLIAIVILWSVFSNRLGANGLRDISKVIMSQTFPSIVATLPNPTGPYCQKREIGPTLIATGANLGISPVWGGPNKKTPLERPPGVWAKKFFTDWLWVGRPSKWAIRKKNPRFSVGRIRSNHWRIVC